jgi:hypothetical protein
MAILRQLTVELIGMKAVFLIFLFACGHAATAQGSKSAQAIAGCYELRAEGLHLFRSYADDFLPTRFQLTTRTIKDGFAVRNLDSNVHWDLPLSSWTVSDAGKLGIVWSTGFVGWNIQLSKSGTNLRGTAQFFTDTPPDWNHPVSVVAHPVDCKG